ncbi:MAG TPA: hypothetical protein VHO94_04295 [Oscillospiraceae bacterium]|nr:hypothetical protein [Oscillospiraceae bacterium]
MVEPKILIGNKEYSISSVKGFSITFYIIGALLMLISFFIMPIGILFLIFGLILLFMGNSYRKMAKNALSPTSPLVMDKDQDFQLTNAETAASSSEVQEQQGHNIKVCLNCGERLLEKAEKCPSCGARAQTYPIINSNDTERIAQIKNNAKRIDYRTGFMDGFMDGISTQSNNSISSTTKRERIRQNKANAIACCPKCGSTSLSANKRGLVLVRLL